MERTKEQKVIELKPHLASSSALLGDKTTGVKRPKTTPPAAGVREVTEKDILLQICLELQDIKALLLAKEKKRGND